jgi:hypothetical protein
MSVIDKVVNEWAFRCKKGYPDMNNPDDMKILKEIYSEYGVVLEEEKPKEEYTVSRLLDLINTQSEVLDSTFIEKIYHTIAAKGKKLGSTLSTLIQKKNLGFAQDSIFTKIDQIPGLEAQVVDYLQKPGKVTFESLGTSGNLADVLTVGTSLPQPFIESIINLPTVDENNKGVGRCEVALALLLDGGHKGVEKGDVQVGNVSLELKSYKARLMGRLEELQSLYSDLEKITGVSPGKGTKSKVNLVEYLKRIALTEGLEESIFKQASASVKREFGNSVNIDFKKPESIKEELLSWYVSSFLSSEAQHDTHVMVYLDPIYRIYTREEFKTPIIKEQVILTNFSATSKYPQITSFA